MARREPKEAPRRGMSPADALHALRLIDASLAAFCETAPTAVASMGGRGALKRASEMTCIGPVPRLDVDTWAVMAAEYEDRKRDPDLFKHTVTGGMAEVAGRRTLPSVRDGGSSR